MGLGSNMGDREATLTAAVVLLRGCFGGLAVSRLYESEPQYDHNQRRFLNAVAGGPTQLGPFELLDRLLAIEKRFARRRDVERPKGPRTLDLDLLLYRDWIVHHPRLALPHPGMVERAFVLIPLVELDPAVRDPGTGITFATYLSQADSEGIYPITS